MPHIRPKNGKEPPQLPFVAQTFQFVSLVFHGGTSIAILLPLVAQTFQFVSVNAQTKSLRDETFAAHQRFSLKNGVRISEILPVAIWVILEELPTYHAHRNT